ncbi:hypothetical protein EBN88_00535 [Streptomyces triticirhizae]|uniref:Phosphoadenosine phosphosulphate reductase domain-containing protein n=1 Tax=Streptomyces triticirhizae TaxID=2483353 RepID=A0A3M2MB78_9ACTN|nr:hypothetical protein EBN88_00535 [Streptomyces triticirhizae]
MGAGVQSTALLLLAARGRLDSLDGAIFADTKWEPETVYRHLDRLEREVAQPAGIPIHRVSAGDIRADALNPKKRFASMPLHILNPDGKPGMMRRQCTSEYKIKPIKRQVRHLLGFPHPTRVPKGICVEQWIGISIDEFHRAKDSDVRYITNRHPLIDLGWTRDDCLTYLRELGFESTPKSACLGCPYHGNAQWRKIRDESPQEWEDVVAFDTAIRSGNARANAAGNPLLGQAFLHRSRLPLSEAPIDRLSAREWAERQPPLPETAEEVLEAGVEDGCSPWSCRSDAPVPSDYDQAA